MSPAQRVEIISSIRQVASKAFFQQGKFGLQNETYYWQAAYHLNIRLYEKLLNGVFDILDEGQLIEEADAILSLIKLTWSTLGITDKLHDALYGWALVQQFVDTAEGTLLEHAVLQLQRVVSAKEDDCNEGQYMNSITCLKERNGSKKKLNLVQSIFLSIGTWCDSKLQDYHLHFSEEPVHFKKVVALASTIGMLSSADCADKVIVNASREKIKSYVERSVEAAIGRVAITVLESKERTHPLALLANQLRLIADRELKIFFPVLRQWSPESMMISVQKLHQFFGERLIPFLKGVSSLSEDARSVLPAAYALDNELGQLYTSALEEQKVQHSPRPYLDHYQIEKVSGPLIIDWVIGQHTRILEWTRRALELEDWEPLSFHQRQAASIVEVFRILEETVDQLFGMNLPLDITHLQALLSIVFHSLDAYLQRVLNQLDYGSFFSSIAHITEYNLRRDDGTLNIAVEKNHLYPSAPPLTRYTETAIPLIKKRLNEYKILDDIMLDRLNEMTIPKLCIRLNTLKYIQKQVGVLEDDIRNSWAAVRPSLNQTQGDEQTNMKQHKSVAIYNMNFLFKIFRIFPSFHPAEEEPVMILESDSLTHNETVDELFGTTFNIIRDTAKDIGQKTCDLIGTRVVFWDLRDAFLFHLYRGNVESTRLESFLPDFDTEGFVWVLLDGGPCRAFSDSDIILMEEDLLTLKEFFIADGEGLPESLVEQEAKFAERILHMFSLQTETVIQMLMTASELISMGLDSNKQGHTNLGDAHTLMRVLCHKKDREASKFLKVQYQLPMSSDYDDTPLGGSTSRLPRMSDVLKRSTSIRWNKKRQSSFKSMKKKIQGATNEIRNLVAIVEGNGRS
ncbi:DNA topoisomerase 4 subunit B [Gossypium australe]|uniref:DNA topoisomerase 4 subunit B n=1 Tax=Gossypium australe TaxID=47621 RepID=A0A5B6UGT5_9ROSI|nr:DNA topoisomerase 4 subunit B [Gossypium australe]